MMVVTWSDSGTEDQGYWVARTYHFYFEMIDFILEREMDFQESENLFP